MLALIHDELWSALGLTLRLALVTTTILVVVGLPLARWLNNARGLHVAVIESIVTLPIVLPPTVIGFYLLVALSPQSFIGQSWQALFGSQLTFTFSGLVVGSVLYSLPFAVQPFQSAFRLVDKSLIEAAAALGAPPRTVFWKIVVRASRGGILTGATLSFAHTLGEFGVVLMLGGSIPGQTRVASIALYDEAQKLNFAEAHAFAAVLLVMSFAMLMLLTWAQRHHAQSHK
ncbi:molybdate ABC transporter permease subunit [Crenobacter luteus]|uniref:molybdate ABC transporter permease subunit n=1 Tax=Crenobacter luteus TaxID=1452487 RepID=UPI000A701D3C|nr:molybdate ABC transporter permease subunit [Crenobacter luteus]